MKNSCSVPAEPVKRFVYLVQAAERMPYEMLSGPDSDVILLTWKKPAAEGIFFPDSTWNEGRNRLLLEALRRELAAGRPYQYYIFLDEDCAVREDTALAKQLGIPLSGNPFRTFETALGKWQPALGCTRYAWQHHVPGREVNTGHNIDALFNAFHREAAGLLLPYYTGFDSESWLYSQNIINQLATLFYHPYRMQFNLLVTRNQDRRGYVARGRNWAKPTRFLAGALRPHLRRRLNRRAPNTISPPPGEPLKKDCSYVIQPLRMRYCFDLRHPYLRQKTAFFRLLYQNACNSAAWPF